MGVADAHGHIRAPTRTRTPAHTHEAPARTLRSNLHKRLSPWYNPPPIIPKSKHPPYTYFWKTQRCIQMFALRKLLITHIQR